MLNVDTGTTVSDGAFGVFGLWKGQQHERANRLSPDGVPNGRGENASFRSSDGGRRALSRYHLAFLTAAREEAERNGENACTTVPREADCR